MMDKYIELKTEEDFKKYWGIACYFNNTKEVDECEWSVLRGYHPNGQWMDDGQTAWKHCFIKNPDYKPHRRHGV